MKKRRELLINDLSVIEAHYNVEFGDLEKAADYIIAKVQSLPKETSVQEDKKIEIHYCPKCNEEAYFHSGRNSENHVCPNEHKWETLNK